MRHTPGRFISIPLDVITFICQKPRTHKNNKLSLKLNEEELLAFFKKHDANKDGKLSWDEVRQAFSDLGASWVSLTTDRALLHADEDEDGYVSEGEMNKLIQFALKRKFTIQ
ncbi:putative EF-hand domain-containing protein [Helianthus debilis subsp. tardiflorus]